MSIHDLGRKLGDKYIGIGTGVVVVVRESVAIIALISLIMRSSICFCARNAYMLYEVMNIENVLGITSLQCRRLLFSIDWTIIKL